MCPILHLTSDHRIFTTPYLRVFCHYTSYQSVFVEPVRAQSEVSRAVRRVIRTDPLSAIIKASCGVPYVSEVLNRPVASGRWPGGGGSRRPSDGLRVAAAAGASFRWGVSPGAPAGLSTRVSSGGRPPTRALTAGAPSAVSSAGRAQQVGAAAGELARAATARLSGLQRITRCKSLIVFRPA